MSRPDRLPPEPVRAGAGPSTLRFDDDLRCDDCGRYGAFDLGERRLCEDCYRGCGSCCPEFGKDDLWPRDE